MDFILNPIYKNQFERGGQNSSQGLLFCWWCATSRERGPRQTPLLLPSAAPGPEIWVWKWDSENGIQHIPQAESCQNALLTPTFPEKTPIKT